MHVPHHHESSRRVPEQGGVLTEDVYHFADQNNITWIGGYHQTIGTGWVLV